MQNSYLAMMETTKRLIERANEISHNAEQVREILKAHKKDLGTMQQMIAERFGNIRDILARDEDLYNERFVQLQNELDQAIAAIVGAEEPEAANEPEPPPAEPMGQPEAPAEELGNVG